ncbi:MAG: hypothetical protein FWF23_03180 [Alphaproteobacteria bacterium]|nr:hypothetical protein [Alphaproteobacteria bacterium]MCL2505703.1 hypothetical protein [Alphaproteobacteria bacterium]
MEDGTSYETICDAWFHSKKILANAQAKLDEIERKAKEEFEEANALDLEQRVDLAAEGKYVEGNVILKSATVKELLEAKQTILHAKETFKKYDIIFKHGQKYWDIGDKYDAKSKEFQERGDAYRLAGDRPWDSERLRNIGRTYNICNDTPESRKAYSNDFRREALSLYRMRDELHQNRDEAYKTANKICKDAWENSIPDSPSGTLGAFRNLFKKDRS